jgi:ubiquinone/menaquinone biosynthesis C-methylase UbiE
LSAQCAQQHGGGGGGSAQRGAQGCGPGDAASEAARRRANCAAGFAADPERYHRARPSYSPEAARLALDAVLSGAAARRAASVAVADVGAGTGKFTRALLDAADAAGRGATLRVAAVDGVEAMLQRLEAALAPAQQARVFPVLASAEALPFASGSLHGVACAQAFHWFATPRALREFARVLADDGALVLLWNTRDLSVQWVADLEVLVDPLYPPDTPRAKSGAWRGAFASAEAEAFWPLESHSLPYTQRASREGVIERFLSISAIASRPPSEQRAVRVRLEAALAKHFAPDADAFDIPYQCAVHVCRRRPRDAAQPPP